MTDTKVFLIIFNTSAVTAVIAKILDYLTRTLGGTRIFWSYAQKLVTVRLGGVLKLLDPVLELNPLNDFWQSICAAELPPFLLG